MGAEGWSGRPRAIEPLDSIPPYEGWRTVVPRARWCSGDGVRERASSRLHARHRSMPIRLILAPYDSGHREWRMGAGPTHLLRHGLASRIRSLGVEVGAEFAEVADRPGTEISTTFALWREVAERVGLARERGELPVVLSGNCGATIGALAGRRGDVGLLWLDAHGDFNTPETSESGFLDGMALATIVGRCWRPLTSRI